MNILVTGADGFVGSWLVPKLAAAGHRVTAAVFSGDGGTSRAEAERRLVDAATIVDLDLTDMESVQAVAGLVVEAVVHLGAVSSGSEALRDPARAWEINAAGTVRLAECLAQGPHKPRILFASTGEVYGRLPDETMADEKCETRPVSPYAASKLGAEIGLSEVCGRFDMPYIIARPFAHTGGGQDKRFVVPGFARRIIDVREINAVAVPVGNIDLVRDFMHVSDVVEAYCKLLEHGEAGEVYNIASGQGTSLRDVFFLVTDAVGSRVIPEVDASYMRKNDIPYLVGDATKLREQTGWTPSVSLQEAITEVVNASSA